MLYIKDLKMKQCLTFSSFEINSMNKRKCLYFLTENSIFTSESVTSYRELHYKDRRGASAYLLKKAILKDKLQSKQDEKEKKMLK